MRVWFDTEFLEDGRTIKLISIGMVREDGATFYKETGDAKWLVEESDWLRENVKPHLKGCVSWPNSYIGKQIVDFVGPNPEFWAYYADYDWVALCQLFGTMMDLPAGWPMLAYDFRQWLDLNGKKHIRGPESAPHDALLDAQWLAETFKEHGPK